LKRSEKRQIIHEKLVIGANAYTFFSGVVEKGFYFQHFLFVSGINELYINQYYLVNNMLLYIKTTDTYKTFHDCTKILDLEKDLSKKIATFMGSIILKYIVE
jgi:hypothetical protein